LESGQQMEIPVPLIEDSLVRYEFTTDTYDFGLKATLKSGEAGTDPKELIEYGRSLNFKGELQSGVGTLVFELDNSFSWLTGKTLQYNIETRVSPQIREARLKREAEERERAEQELARQKEEERLEALADAKKQAEVCRESLRTSREQLETRERRVVALRALLLELDKRRREYTDELGTLEGTIPGLASTTNQHQASLKGIHATISNLECKAPSKRNGAYVDPTRVDSLFKKIDKDNSGAVDRDELMMVHKGGDYEGLFAKLDTNGDGKVTIQEWRSFFRLVQGELGAQTASFLLDYLEGKK